MTPTTPPRGGGRVLHDGVQTLSADQGNRWGPFVPAASTASLPVLITFLIGRRQVIDALVHRSPR